MTYLNANQTFGTKLLHLLTFGTRDFYKTEKGQLISMKADQGRVETGENGEVNIFDAKNVRAKGVDGISDIFNLHNCTGSNNRGKNLNDAGDLFQHVDDKKDESSAKSSDKSSDSSKSDATASSGITINNNITGNNNTITTTVNGVKQEESKTEEADKADKKEETKTDEAKDNKNPLKALSDLFTFLSDWWNKYQG